MKTIVLCLTFLFTVSCSSDNLTESCKYNGHILHKGIEGGCYYINSSGDKEYVDKVNCNC